jgi:uncharacterized protein YceK
LKFSFILILSFSLLAGCATIQNLADQGMKSAEKAAQNYVDKETGSGTFDDMMAMKSDNQKTKKLLPYYISANKLYDEKQITDEKRSELKKSFDELYADYTSSKIDEQTYDKKCTELIDSCKRSDQKTE